MLRRNWLGRCRRGCILRQRIQDKSLHGLCRQNDARSEDAGSDVGDDPVGAFHAGPAVPEEFDRDEHADGDYHRDAILERSVSTGLVLQVCPDAIGASGAALRGYCVADRESNVIEVGTRDGLPVTLGPELGEGGEDDVVQAEAISHGDGHDLEGW